MKLLDARLNVSEENVMESICTHPQLMGTEPRLLHQNNGAVGLQGLGVGQFGSASSVGPRLGRRENESMAPVEVDDV